MENRFFSAVKAILLLLYVLFSAAAFAQEIEETGFRNPRFLRRSNGSTLNGKKKILSTFCITRL